MECVVLGLIPVVAFYVDRRGDMGTNLRWFSVRHSLFNSERSALVQRPFNSAPPPFAGPARTCPVVVLTEILPDRRHGAWHSSHLALCIRMRLIYDGLADVHATSLWMSGMEVANIQQTFSRLPLTPLSRAYSKQHPSANS